MQEGRREFVAAEGSHEFGIDLRVGFEPGRDIGPRRGLDFADKMPEGRRAEPMQPLDEPLAAQPQNVIILGLFIWEFPAIGEVFAAIANSIPGPGSRRSACRVRCVWGHDSPRPLCRDASHFGVRDSASPANVD